MIEYEWKETEIELPEQDFLETTKTCKCTICDKPVQITVYTAFDSEDDCAGVCCEGCAEEIIANE